MTTSSLAEIALVKSFLDSEAISYPARRNAHEPDLLHIHGDEQEKIGQSCSDPKLIKGGRLPGCRCVATKRAVQWNQNETSQSELNVAKRERGERVRASALSDQSTSAITVVNSSVEATLGLLHGLTVAEQILPPMAPR